MGTVPIPLPPIAEQRRIVGILDSAFEKIDAVKYNAEKNLANAKELFQRVLDEEMTPKEGWRKEELQNAVASTCSLSYGIVQPGDEYPNGIPVVRPIDLGGKEIQSVEGFKRTAPDISEAYRRTVLDGGEILLCVRGETGILSIASHTLKGCNVTRGIVPIMFDSHMVSQFFGYYLMMSPVVYSQIKKKTKGTALKQINIGDLRKIQIFYPDVFQQEMIVKNLDKVQKSCEAVINAAKQTIASSVELKQQILAKAFCGEF